MIKMNNKNFFDCYDSIWKSGYALLNISAKIGYHVMKYSLHQIKNKQSQIPPEKKERFIQMIQICKGIKTNYLKEDDLSCSKEEVIVFATKLFQLIRQDENKGITDMNIANKYKMINDTIFTLKEYDPALPEQFTQMTSFCMNRYNSICSLSSQPKKTHQRSNTSHFGSKANHYKVIPVDFNPYKKENKSDDGDNKCYVNSIPAAVNIMKNKSYINNNMKKYSSIIKTNNDIAIKEIEKGNINNALRLLRNSLSYCTN